MCIDFDMHNPINFYAYLTNDKTTECATKEGKNKFLIFLNFYDHFFKTCLKHTRIHQINQYIIIKL